MGGPGAASGEWRVRVAKVQAKMEARKAEDRESGGWFWERLEHGGWDGQSQRRLLGSLLK